MAARRELDGAVWRFPLPSSRQCCWPIGEPGAKDFRFCCEPKAEGKPNYCAEHHGIAYHQVDHRHRHAETAD